MLGVERGEGPEPIRDIAGDFVLAEDQRRTLRSSRPSSLARPRCDHASCARQMRNSDGVIALDPADYGDLFAAREGHHDPENDGAEQPNPKHDSQHAEQGDIVDTAIRQIGIVHEH